ncbi:hypothetical protein LINPERHAP1_LOCUS36640, partial [Linum perenne]
LAEVYSDWVGLYKELPRLLGAIEYWNPDIAYRFFTRPLVTETSITVLDVSIFHCVFWSFAPYIIGLNHCLPVIQVDGTFLKGKYKGTLLVTTTIDGNRQIMPLVFAIIESENTHNWPWFIQCLQMYVTQRRGLAIISDRHAGIKRAMEDYGPQLEWEWRWFVQHFLRNYNDTFHNTEMKNRIWSVARTFQVRKYTQRINELEQLEGNHASANWIYHHDPKHWTMSHDEGHRYGITTTNMVESLNGVYKGIRGLPILALVQHILWHTNKYFTNRIEVYTLVEDGQTMFIAKCMEIMEERMGKSNRFQVRLYSRANANFVVTTPVRSGNRRGGNTHRVILDEESSTGTCTCNKFQSMEIPCSHAIATCKLLSIDF